MTSSCVERCSAFWCLERIELFPANYSSFLELVKRFWKFLTLSPAPSPALGGDREDLRL